MLLDDKSQENVLFYKILHKNFFDPKPLRIRLDKVDGTIKTYDRIKCLELSNTYNKQIFHAFLFNIRNYSPAVMNVQRREGELNIILPTVNNFDMKQKKAQNICFIICNHHQTRCGKIKTNKTANFGRNASFFYKI